VAAFNAQKDSELAFSASGENLCGCGAEPERFRVFADLLEDAFEQRQGALGVAIAPLPGLCPEGKERSGEVAPARRIEGEMAAMQGVGEVPGVVDKALRSIYVGVEDDGLVVDTAGIAHTLYIA
jgi:hypothetical protein